MNTKSLSFFRFILLAIIFMQVTFTYAQEKYQLQIDSIFEIPAYKIPSGILLNRSPAVIDMNIYDPANGQPVDTCTLYKWMSIYYRIYASYLNMDDFQYDKNIVHQYMPLIKPKTEEIDMGIIFYDYDKIIETAVEDGLLLVDTINMKIRDISGAGTPIEPATCFAFSAMADTIPAGNYSFQILPSLFVSNKTATFNEIYIDFDDNQGYVKVDIGDTVNVSYFSLGNKTLKIKAVWEKDTLISYSNLYVTQNTVLESITSVDIPVPDEGPEKYENDGITAMYGIWFRCNHDGHIRKPILIVSGFDPMNKNRIGIEDNANADNVFLYNVANKYRFLDRLREYGYDVIIWRSQNSTESIYPNAMNLIHFITQKINNVKTADNELIVVGVSMGGLVSRYALTYMELIQYEYYHHTKLFISMDSPQNGSNVPLGFQFLVKYLNDDLFGTVPMLKDAKEKMLDCDAAREMLLYHYSATSGWTARCDPRRNFYLNSLSNIGNFPQQCRTMAVSMGSGTNKDQGFNPGAILIKKIPSPLVLGAYMTLDVLLMLVGIHPTIGFTLSHSSWEFEVRAVPNHMPCRIYNEELYINLCGPIPILVPPFLDWLHPGSPCEPHIWKREEWVNNTQPLDNAPGSIFGLHNLKDWGLDEDKEKWADMFEKLKIIIDDSHYDCFIPSYSALGMNVAPHTHIKSYLNGCDGVTKINDNFYANTNKSVSLFDYLYIENDNLPHIYDDNKVGVFSPEMLAAMDTMISREYLYLKNRTIRSGEKVAYEATKLIEVNGNFVVKSGGTLKMNSERIVLKPGFRAEAGSEVRLSSLVDWVCVINKSGSQNLYSNNNPDYIYDMPDFKTMEYAEGENISNDENIKIFPNPVTEILTIELPYLDEKTYITIHDMNGKLLFEKEYSETHIINMNFTNYQQGIYIVKINNNKISSIGKVIKN